MEHLRHFQLSDDPFRNEPLPGMWLETPPHEDALRRIDRGVRQARGLMVLMGEGGAGKTLLLRRLLEQLEEEIFAVHHLGGVSPGADGMWLLRHLAVQLGLEVDPSATGREPLVAQVVEQLSIIREDGRHAVLVIDDAQGLAHSDAMAEVGSLLRLEYEDRRLLSIVLSGDPSLEMALANTPNLATRVDVKARLTGLDAESTRDYMAHRIQRASGYVEIFEPQALEALCEWGRGLPGRMNTLADNALYEAYLSRLNQVTANEIARAHEDLALSALPAEPEASAPVTPSPELLECTDLPKLTDFREMPELPERAIEPAPERNGSYSLGYLPEPVIDISKEPMIEGPIGLESEWEIGAEPELEVDDDLDSEFEAVFDSATREESNTLAGPILTPNDVAEISLRDEEPSDSLLLEPEMRVPRGPEAVDAGPGQPPPGFDSLDTGLEEFLRNESPEEGSLRDLLETS